ncbi:hypothetical protein ED733_008146 [Metarhizium rileyi]|uniref:Uncharacterized protein n=1 Tax=Metarhizium rileyi (strain RCEF 4871) TaxID=1649241 RepID=A0A5C6GGN7_METRR|nr:hypothetical protein ED733_008146 [Metarhizium rileyi]
MDLLPKNERTVANGFGDDGYDPRRDAEPSFHSASQITTSTGSSPGPAQTSSPGEGGSEITFRDFLAEPVGSRVVSNAGSSAGPKRRLSWTVRTDDNDRLKVNWIAWMSRSALLSEESDQVVVEKVTINSTDANGKGENHFLSDYDDGQTGVTINFEDWLNKLHNGKGKEPKVVRRDAAPVGNGRAEAETDFMRLQISWAKSKSGKTGISNSGVFFVKTPKVPTVESSNRDNATGYVETTVDTNVRVLPPASTQSNTAPSSSPAPNAPEQSSVPTAAIIGGCVGGALLIAALVWFCLIRRRRKRTEPSFDSQYKPTSSMEGKAVANAQADDSRLSGRSEDSGRPDYPDYPAHNTAVNPAVAYPDQSEYYQPSYNPSGSFHSLQDTGAHAGPSGYPSHYGAGFPPAAPMQEDYHHAAAAPAAPGQAHDPDFPFVTIPIPPEIREYLEPNSTNDDVRRVETEEKIIAEDVKAMKAQEARKREEARARMS